jgi:hypothetical protein
MREAAVPGRGIHGGSQSFIRTAPEQRVAVAFGEHAVEICRARKIMLYWTRVLFWRFEFVLHEPIWITQQKL